MRLRCGGSEQGRAMIPLTLDKEASMPSSHERFTARDQARADNHAHLVGLLVEVVDRTFSQSGQGEGLRMVREMLMRMDPTALKGLLHDMGVEAPEEAVEPPPEERSRGG